VVKKAPGKAVDKVLLGDQRFPGRRVVPDPVAIEVDAGFGVDVLSSAVFYFS